MTYYMQLYYHSVCNSSFMDLIIGIHLLKFFLLKFLNGQSWSWSYGRWNYLCNQCLSPLKFYARFPTRRSVLYATLCDKLCKWLAVCRCFFPCTPISFTYKSHCHARYCWNIVEIGVDKIKQKICCEAEVWGVIRSCVLKEDRQHNN
jgi:hypothetical protein